MNTANLQLEGLYAALSALIDALKEKNVLNADEIDRALRYAEYRMSHGPDRSPEMSDANLNAVLFPIRLLRVANEGGCEPKSFAELAAQVGRRKGA